MSTSEATTPKATVTAVQKSPPLPQPQRMSENGKASQPSTPPPPMQQQTEIDVPRAAQQFQEKSKELNRDQVRLIKNVKATEQIITIVLNGDGKICVALINWPPHTTTDGKTTATPAVWRGFYYLSDRDGEATDLWMQAWAKRIGMDC